VVRLVTSKMYIRCNRPKTETYVEKTRMYVRLISNKFPLMQKEVHIVKVCK
jgi:hypothetical protein